MDLNLTFQQLINNSGRNYSDKPCLAFVGEDILTYSEVYKRIISLVAHFENLGIARGDKIALLGSNSPNWVISYLASTWMGAVIVPVLPDFSKKEVHNILIHSEAKALVVANNHYSYLNESCPSNIQHIISLEDFSILRSSTKGVNYILGNTPQKEYLIDAGDIAAIIYTSGTTGNSKGVMLSNRNIISNAFMAKKIKYVDSDDSLLSILPLAHTLENTVGMVIPFMSGASIHYLRKLPTASVLLPALAEIRPTIMLAVPLIIEKIYFSKIKPTFSKNILTKTLYRMPPTRKILSRIAGRKLFNTFGGRMEFFGIGGAKINPEVERFLLEARFPYAVGYGLTESSPLLAGMVYPDCKTESTGPAVEGIELKLENIDAKTGEGEIWAKGPNIMKGYYKNPEATKEVLTADGWLKTGDLASLDKEGFIFIKGRSKNVIVGSSGENIYPEEIEFIINRFKHVVDSLVLEKGGKLVAMVHINREELEEKYRHLKEDVTRIVEEKMHEIIEELNIQVNQQLNRFSRIHQFILQPVPFHKTPTKKIKRYLYH